MAVRGGVDHLATVITHHLKRLQYRPGRLDAIIAQTELILEPEPPNARSQPFSLCIPHGGALPLLARWVAK
ncbi:hypothetical protein AB0C28_54870 [Nonomuraea sp. NPDC048892]|uniref:hypothetical protein n=1 Tax=Nonomuraea sp. NPDC048892 TaxID=3154624 RepID=UPI0033F1CF72